MAKSTNQKLKLLYLAKIFFEETDESHGLTMAELISRLKEADISADRKTIYLDLDELRQFGLDILSYPDGKTTRYHLASREFELAELKLLVDSVQSSKFITEKKSRSLIKKLESLVSVYDAKQLHRQVLIAGRVKTMNESIYYNVDKLHTAISQNVQIRFKYFQWNVEKQEEFRHGGAWYCVSPWHLRWDDENYYLIAYDAAAGQLRHYRVDKMKSICLTDTPREGEAELKSVDPAAYTARLFGMYGGAPTRVTLEGENRMAGIVIDRFGKDVPMLRKDDEHFYAHVDVAVSPPFLGWIAGMDGALKITAPESVVQSMQALAQKLCKQYSEA